MISYNTTIVLLGASLLGASAGLVGSFAVLRRRSLMGDALAHAALPGLCIAFLIVGGRNLPAMQLGAFATGVAGVLIVAGLRRYTRIKEDAAIGIVLSVFFGLGIVLVRLIQNQTTTGSKAGLDSYIYGKTAGMIASDVYFIAGVSVVCLLTIALLFKEFRVVSFDPGFAHVQGLPTFALDTLLMALISLTVVIGLPAVGVVLVAALLILPAAAARFWTDRLGRMVLLASALGWLIGAVGAALSARYSGLPTGPVIVLVGAAVFLFSVLLAPRRGFVARALRRQSLRRRIADQQLLEDLAPAAIGALDLPPLSPAQQRRALGQGWIEQASGRLRLTAPGAQAAQQAARRNAAWRMLLRDYPDQIPGLFDLDFDEARQNLTPDLRAQLERRLLLAGAAP